MTYEQALRQAIADNPIQGRRAAKLLKLLNARASKRRTRQLARMERHTAALLGLPEAFPIDWSRIDWSKWLPTIIGMLLALLPFILA